MPSERAYPIVNGEPRRTGPHVRPTCRKVPDAETILAILTREGIHCRLK
jgi:hypothetical protein